MGNQLDPIADMDQWVSPRLGIRFAWKRSEGLTLYVDDFSLFANDMKVLKQAREDMQAFLANHLRLSHLTSVQFP